METNKFKRAWIWFWYNNFTRICIVMGLPVLPVVVITYFIFGTTNNLRTVALVTYSIFLVWALIDNDYSNLRRIGMNEYRRKL